MILTRNEWRNIKRGLIFTSPWILGILLFVVYPVGASLYYSFTDFSVLLPPVPVGFRNYAELFQDDLFHKSIWNTLVYTTLALPLSLVLSLFIAILLHEKIRFQGFFRTVYFIPSLVPLIPLGILWQWIFNNQYGIINLYLDPLLK
ncbi:sugar ABC transporter permease, partial [Candidatus Sumerlaeota bacterium]|nr:sugar ABC transporter permease [Candidatus Sumerlaeota bacterium]